MRSGRPGAGGSENAIGLWGLLWVGSYRPAPRGWQIMSALLPRNRGSNAGLGPEGD